MQRQMLVLGMTIVLSSCSDLSGTKPPDQTAPCNGADSQRIPYKNGTICVTNPFAELLACFELNNMSELAQDAKAGIAAGGGNTAIHAKAEANAAADLTLKYGNGQTGIAVKACIDSYTAHTISQPQPAASQPQPQPAASQPQLQPAASQSPQPHHPQPKRVSVPLVSDEECRRRCAEL